MFIPYPLHVIKRILGPAFLWLVLALGAGFAAGADSSDTLVLSGCEIDYPPFCMVDGEGQADGFSVELMRAALERMGHTVTFRTGPWSDVRGWLEQGEIDALPLVGRTPEREALFDFTVPYLTMRGAIVVRQETDNIRRLADLRGRRVGVMQGDNAEEFLRRQPLDFSIWTTPTFSDAFHALAAGDCDAVVIQQLVAIRLLEETGLKSLKIISHPIREFAQDFCFAVKEGDRELLSILNEGLALVVADGTHRQLHAKWFAQYQLPVDGPIVVGGDYDYPPFEYLNADGVPDGYNVELTRAIAAATGLDVEIRLGPWSEIVRDLEKGDIDILQGMYYLPGRDAKFDFTQPHLASSYVGIARKGEGEPPDSIDDLVGKQIIVQRDDAFHDYLIESGFDGPMALADTQVDTLRELAEGKHDYALGGRISALSVIEENGWDNLTLARRPFVTLEYCYAAQNNRKALLAKFSEGLNTLENSGDYQRIFNKWLGVYETQPMTLMDALRKSALFLAAAALAFMIIAGWSWSLRRQVSARTRALNESLARFRAVFESANVGKSITLPTGEVNVNQAFADMLGYTREEMQGKTWQELTPPEDIPDTLSHITPLLEGREDATHFEKRYRRQDGATIWADVNATMVRDAQNQPLHFITTVMDITATKQTEEALRESEERQRAMIACSPVALYTIDLNGIVLSWNQSSERVFGWSAEEVIGQPLPIVPEDKRDEFRALRKGVTEGRVFTGRELVRQRKDGTLFPVSLSVAPVLNRRGETIGIMGAAEDITERKQLETERQKFFLLAESSSEFIGMCDLDMNPLYVNPAGRRMVGLPDMAAACRVKVQDYYFPEDQQFIAEDFFPRVLRDGHGDVEIRLRHFQTGEPIWMFYYLFSVHDAGGVPVGWATVSRDITENKRAEAERENLQSQLYQAQKMDSIGRLAGGVAHDFNNMLNVILGHAELAIDDLPADSSLRDDLKEIQKAAERSANLTRQLLAFARKQTIAPKILDINETITSMLKMLNRLIGEDIDLLWQPGNNLAPVCIDPGQIDQLLANLVVNARDAIGHHTGKITIETAHRQFDEAYCSEHVGFVPGDYVLFAVSDDGCGMDERTCAKIFEPFFTTKDLGQGTGLGLATVYGIVKQNDGFINVYSEPDKGTTFRIYLPAHTAESRGPEDHATAAADAPVGGHETILIVEDEASILNLARTMLERLGYTVLTAATPSEALQMAHERSGTIDLLITDVVMPEMNGRDLAQALKEIDPGIKSLFMSGYTANVIAHQGVLDAGVHFMQKPFSQADLAAKAREALEAE